MKGYKKLYDQLLKSGDLFEVSPDSIGDWSKDKIKFIDLQNQMNYLINTDLNLDEEDQEEDFD